MKRTIELTEEQQFAVHEAVAYLQDFLEGIAYRSAMKAAGNPITAEMEKAFNEETASLAGAVSFLIEEMGWNR